MLPDPSERDEKMNPFQNKKRCVTIYGNGTAIWPV